jgi:hypothetical protein
VALTTGCSTGPPCWPTSIRELSERLPAGTLHINDQTIDDEAQAPSGGVGALSSARDSAARKRTPRLSPRRSGVTVQGQIERYPFWRSSQFQPATAQVGHRSGRPPLRSATAQKGAVSVVGPILMAGSVS